MVRRADSNGARASWAMANSIAPLIEVRSANERGASSRRSPKFFADVGVADRRPIDDHPLRRHAGPLHKAQADAAVAARRIASSTRGSETAAA